MLDVDPKRRAKGWRWKAQRSIISIPVWAVSHRHPPRNDVSTAAPMPIPSSMRRVTGQDGGSNENDCGVPRPQLYHATEAFQWQRAGRMQSCCHQSLQACKLFANAFYGMVRRLTVANGKYYTVANPAGFCLSR